MHCYKLVVLQIYGKAEVFDVDRLIDLLSAFESFSEASQSARGTLGSAEFVIPTGNNAPNPQGSAPRPQNGQPSFGLNGQAMTSINVPVPFGWILGIPPEGVAVSVPTFAAQGPTSADFSPAAASVSSYGSPQNGNGRPTPAQEGVAR